MAAGRCKERNGTEWSDALLKGGSFMPTYEYRCGSCGKKFSILMSMAEYGKRRVKCPKCGKSRVTQIYSTFYAKTSKKS